MVIWPYSDPPPSPPKMQNQEGFPSDSSVQLRECEPLTSDKKKQPFKLTSIAEELHFKYE